MQVSSNETPNEHVRRDSTKIYFFIIAIVALLATNVYFYVKYKNSGNQVYELTNEKVNMQAEVDRIEIELERLSADNLTLSGALSTSRDSVRTMISELRKRLDQHNISQNELTEARRQILELRNEVSRYAVEVDVLRKENVTLALAKDSLEKEVASGSVRVEALEEENSNLSSKVKLASAIKVSSLNILGIRERSKGREEPDARAARVDKFRIHFTVADNPIAEKGMREIYIRVIDPNGNLRTPGGNDFFTVDGNTIQYTDKTAIEFSNDGKAYSVDWRDSKPLQKGTYTILLYADNAVMGRSSIILK